MKKFFVLLLALCLILSAVPTAFADVWIPELEDINEHLAALPGKEGDCAVLNRYLTRYAETGVAEIGEYYPSKDNHYLSLLKHFELNPEPYPDAVSCFTAEDGIPYMQINGDMFQAKMAELYNAKLPVENCPGYAEGKICVTAENYGAEKCVFASAVNCSIISPNVYYVYFEVFFTTEEIEAYLSVPNAQLDRTNLELLGEGSCMFYFYGDQEQSSFASEDFTFLEYNLYNQLTPIPNSGGNSPLPQAGATDDTEEIPTVVVSTADAAKDDAEQPQGGDAPIAEHTYPDGSVPETIEETGEKESDRNRMTLFLALGVAGVALLALAAVLVLFRKKEKN